MTDREALFREILRNPDDDTLRLIYADAIEEEGDGRRAAFIRAQVRFAHVPEYDSARLHNADWGYVPAWVMEFPPLPDGLDWAQRPFIRGFPASVQARDATAFVSQADELFAQWPIESVELVVARLSEARAFARCEWVSRLTRLKITEGLSGQAATMLLNSTHYERLRELHIGAGLTTAGTATAVVGSRVFRQLTTLSCRDDRGGGRALVTALTRLADPPQLKVLDLSGSRLGEEQLGRLLAAPAVSAVEDLDIGENNLGPEGFRVLATARLPHLRSLHLFRTRPTTDGVAMLLHAPFLPRLHSLALGGNNLSPAAATLADAPAIAELRVLDMPDNRLGDMGATALANSPHLRNLLRLDLAENQIEDAGATALAESPHLGGLLSLDLYGNIISPAATDRLKRRFGDRVFL